jgi:hypothetical protein
VSSFTEASFTPLPDGKRWRVNEPGFTYGVGTEESETRIHVPGSWITDMASVPQAFHSYIGPWGKHGMAAVLHDWLYKDGRVRGKPITRKEADVIFLEAMKVSGVRASKRRLIYRAVRLGGWRAWNKHRKAKNSS